MPLLGGHRILTTSFVIRTIRYLDKLVDELAKVRLMAKVLRSA